MILKSIKEQTVLYDHTDISFYGEHEIKINATTFIRFNTTTIQELIDLEEKMDRTLFKALISTFNGFIFRANPNTQLSSFKNELGLTVYYTETKEYLAIISLGERQPMRYQVILEGLFKK